MKLRNKKTGEIVELTTYGFDCSDIHFWKDDNTHFQYHTLADLNEEWEDYEPKEPHIKDEKIRKAVRAWAEANGVGEAEFEYVDGVGSIISFGTYGARIVFYEDLELTNRKRYTIEELCGEEEQ